MQPSLSVGITWTSDPENVPKYRYAENDGAHPKKPVFNFLDILTPWSDLARVVATRLKIVESEKTSRPEGQQHPICDHKQTQEQTNRDNEQVMHGSSSCYQHFDQVRLADVPGIPDEFPPAVPLEFPEPPAPVKGVAL